MLQRAKELKGGPPRFGGWVYMGMMREFWKETNRGKACLSLFSPSSAWAEGRTALVEAQIYVDVRGNALLISAYYLQTCG